MTNFESPPLLQSSVIRLFIVLPKSHVLVFNVFILKILRPTLLDINREDTKSKWEFSKGHFTRWLLSFSVSTGVELKFEMLIFEEGVKPNDLEKKILKQRRESTTHSTHM